MTPTPSPPADKSVEGVVELLANGSGFIRLSPPDPTDDDVYISAAQVKRCELVSGDRIGGPLRAAAPLRALPVAGPGRHDQRPPGRRGRRGHPLRGSAGRVPGRALRARLRGPDREGDRVADAVRQGLARRHRRAGARPARPRRCAGSPARSRALEGLDVSLVLAGVRPEEIGEWREGPVEPGAALSFAASTDAQAQAVEQAIELGRRVAARGGDAVVLIDTLEHLPPHAARRALAAARNITDGGSLTVIATAPAPARRRDDRRDARRRAHRAAASSRRSTSPARASCAPSGWSATRAPRRSPRRARDQLRARVS